MENKITETIALFESLDQSPKRSLENNNNISKDINTLKRDFLNNSPTPSTNRSVTFDDNDPSTNQSDKRPIRGILKKSESPVRKKFIVERAYLEDELQTRLSETQTKIEKLQERLPKLSSLDLFKIKYNENNNNKETILTDEVPERDIIVTKEVEIKPIDAYAELIQKYTEMEKKNKKRSNSFRKIFPSFFGLKEKKDDTKRVNGHLENLNTTPSLPQTTYFQRGAPERHTFSSYPRCCSKFAPPQLLEDDYSLPIDGLNRTAPPILTSDYVCMDKPLQPNYVNLQSPSSSLNTLQSELSAHDNRVDSNSSFDFKDHELINPKASIPITSERQLPNPYRQNKTDECDPKILNTNETIFEAPTPIRLRTRSLSPEQRYKMDIKLSSKKSMESTHQNLEMEIDYPNNMNESLEKTTPEKTMYIQDPKMEKLELGLAEIKLRKPNELVQERKQSIVRQSPGMENQAETKVSDNGTLRFEENHQRVDKERAPQSSNEPYSTEFSSKKKHAEGNPLQPSNAATPVTLFSDCKNQKQKSNDDTDRHRPIEVQTKIQNSPIKPDRTFQKSDQVTEITSAVEIRPNPVSPILPSPIERPIHASLEVRTNPVSPISPSRIERPIPPSPSYATYQNNDALNSPLRQNSRSSFPIERGRPDRTVPVNQSRGSLPPTPQMGSPRGRSMQPVDRRIQPSPTISSRSSQNSTPTNLPKSPQKLQNLQNVEAFYWQKIHEMKQQEYANQAYYQQPRGRSMDAHQGRNTRRSLSLPRSQFVPGQYPQSNPQNYQVFPNSEYGVIYPPFVRGSPQRSSTNDVIYENFVPGVQFRHQAQPAKNPTYAPIFKRGSLQPSEVTPPQQPSKKVSFDRVQWPTKNGYVQSPPTRRNRVESGEEELYGKTVTVRNKVCDMYGQIHDANEKIYGQIKKSGVIYGELKRSASLRSGDVTDYRNKVRGVSTPQYDSPRGVQPVYDNPRGAMCSPSSVQRVLPPIPRDMGQIPRSSAYMYNREPNRFYPIPSESGESGSEAGEIQRILQQGNQHQLYANQQQIYKNQPKEIPEEEWNADGKRGPSGNDSGGGNSDGELRGSRTGRSARRDDPRRHTLSGDQHMYNPGGQPGGILRTMDLEGSLPRGYPPPSSAMLFDDDPGIMSEVETSSTGFRRGGKQRSSLPVVRTPSKTLERPLGLVFLQYRNETKRALLPNEITSIDTVKALFVRSFPKQLTMEYLDSPLVKIYIHDSSKDMFYELEDLRSHLRDIRDRSVLRLFESTDISGGLPGAGQGIAGGVGHFEDQSYFSEPEFDSEYQHQHIHKSKSSSKAAPPYYMGSTGTLPRGGPLLRTYSPAVGAPVPADRIKTLPGQTGFNGLPPPKPVRTYTSNGNRQGASSPGQHPHRYAPFLSPTEVPNDSQFLSDRMRTDGYMSSPERSTRGQYEDPYYSQFAPRSGSITPVIDEEASDNELLDESYSLYGAKLPPGGPRVVPAPRSQFPAPAAVPYDTTRIRVEHMERQLANLTGLVQKALTQAPPPTRDFLVPPGRESFRDDSYLRSESKTPKLGKTGCHKSVSFEKSVSFSDEPPDMNSPKQHSPQHTADTKPPKPAIKSSTLPRTSSQERDRLKPAPPPKPATLTTVQYDSSRHLYRDLQLTPEMYNQLRGLQKKAKDLRAEVRNLRRMSQAQAHSVRETIRDTFIKIRTMLLVGGEQAWQAGLDQEKVRLSREEDLYKQEMIRLEKDLSELESTVEELRGNVINRKTRVNMSDVENMALILSKSSKTVADLKVRFPGLQEGLKTMLSTEMEKAVREEKFLKEEPERLESALRRCKKLTGTLVTLKRLASVQEQRLPCAAGGPQDGTVSPTAGDEETPPVTPTSSQQGKPPSMPSTRSHVGPGSIGGDSIDSVESSQRPENALDALLDELQTFSRPHPPTLQTQQSIPTSHAPPMAEIGRKGSMDSHALTISTGTGSLRRLHSYPSGSDTDNSPPIQPAPRANIGVKPPLPERNAELLQALAGRRVPPPPPPRTSSRSPLASPTSPSVPPRNNNLQHIQNVQNMTAESQEGMSTLRRNVPGRSSLKERAQTLPRNIGSNLQVHSYTDTELQMLAAASNSSSCESVNSQEGASKKSMRQEQLELRHQELLKKQKALQEQYARLQQMQRGNNALTVVPPAPDLLLKKTGSESNILQKMGLNMSTAQTGSLTHLANSANFTSSSPLITKGDVTNANSTTSKVYETDIL